MHVEWCLIWFSLRKFQCGAKSLSSHCDALARHPSLMLYIFVQSSVVGRPSTLLPLHHHQTNILLYIFKNNKPLAQTATSNSNHIRQSGIQKLSRRTNNAAQCICLCALCSVLFASTIRKFSIYMRVVIRYNYGFTHKLFIEIIRRETVEQKYYYVTVGNGRLRRTRTWRYWLLRIRWEIPDATQQPRKGQTCFSHNKRRTNNGSCPGNVSGIRVEHHFMLKAQQ